MSSTYKLVLRTKPTVPILCAGIIDWNPCSGTRPPGHSSAPSSYIVAVGSYVYIHCSAPHAGSYMMQCPGSTVWNPQANGCTDFGGGGQSPPRLIGPLNSAGHLPQGGVGEVTSTPSTTIRPQVTAGYQNSLHQLFAGLPYSLLSSVSRPPPPSGSAGDLASQMTVNPCVVDEQGTLSPLRFHPYPNDPSKYLECVPAERSVIPCCYEV